ncbi:MAG: response regulator [Rhodocyclaceae bacterium]|nr:response regulator [Rhodocyclaceae bacterium]MDZ4215407.1 response regulator [Rhodocyclaceae bacterium]
MSAAPRILVATDVVADADLVRKLLAEEFEDTRASTDLARAVTDFESYKPDILILAFNGLEKAERYYLGLYRLGTLVHALPHRTLILCNKDDLTRVYDLCRKEYFDDYILFWPPGHDAPRLRMAVHHALRQMRASGTDAPNAGEFARQARRVAELEGLLAAGLERGGTQLAAAGSSLQQAGKDIDAAIDGFSRSLSEGENRHLVEVRDPAGLQRELEKLKSAKIHKRLAEIESAMVPARDWLDELKTEVAPALASARALGTLAEQVRPLILLIDDDPFLQRLVTQMLDAQPFELICAGSGAEGLAMLRKRRPDLVLMDYALPDIDGIEATRRLKGVAQFAEIPVVMITGNSEKAVVVGSLKAGAAEFIVKPIDKDKLLAKIGGLLR